MTETTHDESICGKYRVGANQVALTSIGATYVSTIWWKRDGRGGDWFETLLLPSEPNAIPTSHASEAEALKGHATAVAKLVKELTAEPVIDEPHPEHLDCDYCGTRFPYSYKHEISLPEHDCARRAKARRDARALGVSMEES